MFVYIYLRDLFDAELVLAEIIIASTHARTHARTHVRAHAKPSKSA